MDRESGTTPSGRREDDLDLLAASSARLLATIQGLTDDDARRPSRLPGWTVGHVLTHLARNADSVVRRLEGAARDEIVDQYPGGPAGRAAEIESGADRPAAELVQDVRGTAAAVDRTARALPPEAWDRLSRSVDGSLHPAHRVIRTRIREVELHHTDMGLGYEPRAWPTAYVDADLPLALATLSQRADGRALLAWLSGRGPAPELSPWP